ncbi:MAG TPA: toll/interleukin-1 receptor domain-containing protein [Thermoanaerobaculia bacterium]|nr:toll/interleukin-1 receptor domain-containing protein [Thermoanaerobaculia bacterium]
METHPNQEASLSAETFDVFFSYNSKDRDAVRLVADEMRRQGVRVWMDEEVLPLGQSWQPHVEEALKGVRSAAILLGPSSFGDWQKEEARLCQTQGVKRGIPVIAVLLPGGPDLDTLPEFLKERTCSDLRNDGDGVRLQRLIREIRGTAGEPSTLKAVRPSHGPKIHNLPFLSLGDLLKGRDEELLALETNLHGPTAATAITQTQAIHGLGGIGKTRLAVEYAWRSGERYDAVLFVVADSPEALRSGLAGLISLGLHDLIPVPSRAQEEDVAAVLAWLREHNRWLLILDNVDTEEAAAAVRKILPRLHSGQVLITSRRKDWPPSIKKQQLGKLASEEATQFLLQRTDGLRTSTQADSDSEWAGQLVTILDSLPLALEQAAAYIARHQMTFSEYLEIWEKERESVLDWRDEDQMEYPASIAATWQTTFNQLHPTAAAILRLTAYLAPDPIPLDMFEKGTAVIEEAVGLLLEETGQKAPQTVREGLAELAAYSMFTRDGESGTVHRMVQVVVRGHIPEEHRRGWIERTLRLVNDYAPFDADDVRTWPVWNVLRPHAAVVADHADRAGIADPTAVLMSQLALLLLTKGLYVEAEPLMHRALKIDEDSFGQDHPNVGIRINNLAQLLGATNRFAEAEPLMRRALKIGEDSFGKDHPDVAIRLNNLAQLLQATNRLAEAEPLMRQALKIDEESFGKDHPDVAGDLNNLAQLLQATNRLAEAEPLLRRALKISEESFGSEHPNVARNLHNLATLLRDTDRLQEAEPAIHRAVKIYETSLGLDHPRTQTARHNLEVILEELKSQGSST